MAKSKKQKQIELEIEHQEKLISGIYYYLKQTRSIFDKVIKEYSDHSSEDLRFEDNPDEAQQLNLLKNLKELLQSLRARAIAIGIPESDITDEKLVGYVSLEEAESLEEVKRIALERKKGRSMKEILQSEPKFPKIH